MGSNRDPATPPLPPPRQQRGAAAIEVQAATKQQPRPDAAVEVQAARLDGVKEIESTPRRRRSRSRRSRSVQ
eukprot:551324-Pyramimonas_sp.AAC.1